MTSAAPKYCVRANIAGRMTISATMKDSVTTVEGFLGPKAQLSGAGTMTEFGQRFGRALGDTFGKIVARARDPITKTNKEIQQCRDAMKIKAVDESNQWRKCGAKRYVHICAASIPWPCKRCAHNQECNAA
ncbi:hypothetical protein [Bradyrhizobium sp. RDM4]|uniref:hypothetical protein n=1 Tax=Bradyrhizobium sp. RDM4 TaxID=3378765 RepID=UPI0038FC9782